jgi:hypothetical protein
MSPTDVLMPVKRLCDSAVYERICLQILWTEGHVFRGHVLQQESQPPSRTHAGAGRVLLPVLRAAQPLAPVRGQLLQQESDPVVRVG